MTLFHILSVLGALLEITQLDQALKANKSHPFQIEWHPFQLNPNMPSIGMDRRDYLEHKFGSKMQGVEFYSTIEKKPLNWI